MGSSAFCRSLTPSSPPPTRQRATGGAAPVKNFRNFIVSALTPRDKNYFHSLHIYYCTYSKAITKCSTWNTTPDLTQPSNPFGNLIGLPSPVSLAADGCFPPFGGQASLMISKPKRGVCCKCLMFVLLALVCASAAWAGPWTALGPDGGDVRSLAYDPQNPDHIFLGTSTGTLFSSTDGGHSWSRFAHLGSGDDYVIDHLAIDPQSSSKMYAAAWSAENRQSGDLFRSDDAGKSWEMISAMHGKSIRALAIAVSDSRILIAGALDGVFRSSDAGRSWQKISSSSPDIHNLESIAIDPRNPDVVYAGTLHLAWKTADGGRTLAYRGRSGAGHPVRDREVPGVLRLARPAGCL